MRIVYVTERAPFGRGESFIIPEIHQLLEDGHEVLILPFGKAEVFHQRAQALIDRTRVISLASPVVLFWIAWTVLWNPTRTMRAAWMLRGSMSFKQLVLNVVASLKGIYAVRVATQWRADHVHVHWANYTATLGMTMGVLSQIPWSFTAHRYDIIANNLLTNKVEHASFARFISESGLRLASGLIPPAAMRNCHVLHMGVAVPCDSELLPAPRATSLFLCPAALIPRKGHAYLIDAVALLGGRGVRVEVWLIGDGPMRNEIRRHIESVQTAASVRLIGPLPHEEVLNLYRTNGTAGVVLPSIDVGDGPSEGIPVSLMEAMSFGVPVVSTRVGGTPELLDDGGGLLVSQRDATALADAMQMLVENPELRWRVGEAGRRRVEKHFDIRMVARQLASMFEASLREMPTIGNVTVRKQADL